MFIRTLIAFGAATAFATVAARADQAIQVGGAWALLNSPTGGAKASAILIPGGDGELGVKPDGSFSGLKGNQLVRTRKAYLGQGVATLTIDSGVNVAAAVAYMRKLGGPVAVVATSRGTLRVASSLAAKPDAIVLTAGFLDDVRGAVGSPSRLPRTLVVHHRQDGCKKTPPQAVEPFKAWGGAKVTVVWKSGGVNEGDPCQAKGYHGFSGLDGEVVSTVASFAKGG
jgi:hypothetical protein